MDCFLNEVENLLLETANPSRRAGGGWGEGATPPILRGRGTQERTRPRSNIRRRRQVERWTLEKNESVYKTLP